jgi:hypothetical protein
MKVNRRKKTTTVSMDESVLNSARNVAREQRRSLSSLIEFWLVERLETLPKKRKGTAA